MLWKNKVFPFDKGEYIVNLQECGPGRWIDDIFAMCLSTNLISSHEFPNSSNKYLYSVICCCCNFTSLVQILLYALADVHHLMNV